MMWKYAYMYRQVLCGKGLPGPETRYIQVRAHAGGHINEGFKMKIDFNLPDCKTTKLEHPHFRGL